MEPKFVDLAAFTVMGIQVHEMPDKVNYKAVWEDRFMAHHDAILGQSADKAYYGVWFPHHEDDNIPDYLAGMAVVDEATAPEGVTMRQVRAARYAVFECTMETIGQTYGYIYGTWMDASPYEFAHGCADFEYYPPEGVEGPTAVYIPIREKTTTQ